MHTYALTNADKIKNSSAKELLQMRYIKVLRGNFSAVDTCARNRATMASRKREIRRQRENNGTAGGGGTGRFCKRVSAKPLPYLSPRRLSVVFPKGCEAVQLFVVNTIVSIWQFIRFSK